MIGRLAPRLYRGALTVAAGAAALGGAVPAAPGAWRRASERLGRLPAATRAVTRRGPVLWFHAASVGELRAVRPLVDSLRSRRPGRVVLVTTLTRTGLALARELPGVDVAMLLPIDAAGPVRELLDGMELEAFCFTETEIWPTLLGELGARTVPAFMVSGRVSERTAARAGWLRPLYAPALAGVVCCMQSAADASRVVTLGADPTRVHVAGSLKFEHVATEPPASVRTLASWLGARPLLVAGSTHDGEERLLLDVYRRLLSRHPELVLLLAPRHPDRLGRVRELITEFGCPLLSYQRVTTGDDATHGGPGVVLLDVMGPLAHCYGLGVAAFVGGSLVPVGGHNVLEPARAARPVLVGPYTENAGDAVARILEAGGGQRVRSADDLEAAVAVLLDDPPRAREMGERARAAIASGDGALARHLALIEARLGPVTGCTATG